MNKAMYTRSRKPSNERRGRDPFLQIQPPRHINGVSPDKVLASGYRSTALWHNSCVRTALRDRCHRYLTVPELRHCKTLSSAMEHRADPPGCSDTETPSLLYSGGVSTFCQVISEVIQPVPRDIYGLPWVVHASSAQAFASAAAAALLWDPLLFC